MLLLKVKATSISYLKMHPTIYESDDFLLSSGFIIIYQ